MEPLFTNTFIHNRKNLIQVTKKLTEVPIVILLVLAAIHGLLTLSALFFNDSVGSFLGYFFSLLFLLLFYLFLLNRKIKMELKQSQELYHTELESKTIFFEDSFLFVNQQSKGETRLTYSQIKKLKQTKDLFLLIMSAKIVIAIDKRQFDQITQDQFVSFLKEKIDYKKIKV